MCIFMPALRSCIFYCVSKLDASNLFVYLFILFLSYTRGIQFYT